MSACPRTFEVEALRDGRLGGSERAGFERHLSTCSACARELAALERLGAALCDSHPTSTDELEVRRARTRLLVAFNQSLIGRAGEAEDPLSAVGSRVSRRALGALAAGVAVAAGALWFGARADEKPALPASAVTVRADAGARWTRQISERRELILLDEGRLWIQVRRTGSGNEPPLLVGLPDGELEDLGTTFTVSAESGRTTLVAVEEGSVLLRLRGQAPRTIGARGSWAAPPEEPAPREQPFEPSASAPSAPVPAVKPPAPAVMTAPRPVGSGELPAPGGASERFKAAMQALNRGDGRDAAARFSRFLEQYPRDPRAEDAAYLRVLAHQRSGDSSELQRAARYYLRAYPAGFRRREVAALLPSVP